MKPLLRVEDFGVASTPAAQGVQGLDLQLIEGAVGALFGGSHAGKTRLLQAMAGLITPERGRLVVAGEEMSALSAAARRGRGLSLSFQHPPMFRAHAARDHVALASRGVPPSAAQRDRLHALLPELAGLWASPVARLTRRARRIVDLARAIVAEPRLVLLDELALDLGAERAGEVVRALAREGRTVLVAERFPEPLIGLADAAWVLHQGRVLLCGHPSDVARDDRLWGACIGDLPPPATR